MITYYYKTRQEKKFVIRQTYKTGSWVRVESPARKELEELVFRYGLEAGHLADALDENEVPRFEKEGDVYYVITRVPQSENGNIRTIPFLIVLHPDSLFTVAPEKIDLLDQYSARQTHHATSDKLKLFISIFSLVVEHHNLVLTMINKRVSASSSMMERINNRKIFELVHEEHIINSMLNGMVRTNAVLNTMLTGKTIPLGEEDRELIEDLFLSTGQLIDLMKSSMLNVRNIREAFSTIINNNLNRVIKFFTALTIVLTIPTIISSFFGMNVVVPWGDNPLAFGMIALVTAGLCLAVFYYFLKRDWL